MGQQEKQRRKNMFWFGHKAHLAISTESQYIIWRLTSPGSLNDGKALISLLKQIQQTMQSLFQAGIMDNGYDYKPIFQQLQGMNILRLLVCENIPTATTVMMPNTNFEIYVSQRIYNMSIEG